MIMRMARQRTPPPTTRKSVAPLLHSSSPTYLSLSYLWWFSPSHICFPYSSFTANICLSTLLIMCNNPSNLVPTHHPMCELPPSQVPQPTCYWKWVGFPIPLKQANLTLRASSSAILRYSVLNGCFLSSYGSQRALTPM